MVFDPNSIKRAWDRRLMNGHVPLSAHPSYPHNSYVYYLFFVVISFLSLLRSKQENKEITMNLYKYPMRKSVHVTCMFQPTNYMHVMVNMHVTLLLHECYMQVVRVLEMVAHVPCMLYEC